jgi:hypothetical protein
VVRLSLYKDTSPAITTPMNEVTVSETRQYPIRPMGRSREAVILYRVHWITLGFWLLFFAYSTAQLLQTSVNGASGFVCLALVYFLFAGAALWAPWLITRIPPHVLIPLSSMPYVAMVGANLAPDKGGLLTGCAFVGVGAASLWSAHGTYVTAAAVALSASANIPLTQAASKVNSMFYRAHYSSGGLSCLLTSVLFLVADPSEVMRGLFLLLTAVAGSGFFVLSAMLPAGDETDRVFAVPLLSIMLFFRDLFLATRTCIKKTTGVMTASPCDCSSESSRPGSCARPSPVCATSSQETQDSHSKAVQIVKPLRTTASTFVSVRGFLLMQPSTSDRDSLGTINKTPSANETPTVTFLFLFMWSDRRMLLLAPTILTFGAGMGLFNTVFYSSIVAGGPGIAYLGFIGALQVSILLHLPLVSDGCSLFCCHSRRASLGVERHLFGAISWGTSAAVLPLLSEQRFS